MRIVVQRVKSASVKVDHKVISTIGRGLLVLAGVGKEDTLSDKEYIARKLSGLRIFPEGDKETGLSVKDVEGEILLVSQFTLYGDMRKGRRPSFSDAMHPDAAQEMFDSLVKDLIAEGHKVQTGKFGAMMDVELVNDGPYTILIDSKKSF